MRLLLVEEDAVVGESIRKGLNQDGYVVDWVRDGRAAEGAMNGDEYALVLLDIGLPPRDGFAVLECLRRRGNSVPVLVLAARDVVAGETTQLDSGAAGHVPRPLYLDELAERIKAVMRRKNGGAEYPVRCGTLALDPATHRVTLRGRNILVSSREFALLLALLEHPGKMLSRAQLEERLYGWGEEVASNSVEVHIHNLRRKLGEAVIRTVRGVGYAIGSEDDDTASA